MTLATSKRVEVLEREVNDLRRQLDHISGTFGNLGRQQPVRIAKTWSDSPGSYPDEPANTFEIVFQDAAIDAEEAGDKTLTLSGRSSAPSDYATTVDSSYIERGTAVYVTRQNGHWWIVKTPVSEASSIPNLPTIKYSVSFNAGLIYGFVTSTGVTAIEEVGDHGVEWHPPGWSLSNGAWGNNGTYHFDAKLRYSAGVWPRLFDPSRVNTAGMLWRKNWLNLNHIGGGDLYIDAEQHINLAATTGTGTNIYYELRISGTIVGTSGWYYLRCGSIANWTPIPEWYIESCDIAWTLLNTEVTSSPSAGPVPWQITDESGNDILDESGDNILTEWSA